MSIVLVFVRLVKGCVVGSFMEFLVCGVRCGISIVLRFVMLLLSIVV